MDAEYLACDDGRDRKGVEAVDESLPGLNVAASLALIVETVDSGDVGALVVPPQKEEVLRVFELVAKEEEDSLEGLLAAIDIVAEEEIVGVGRETAHLEHADQVGVLAVDITDDFDGRVQFEKCRLAQQNFACPLADGCDFGVFETYALGDFACVTGVQQPLDEVVQVNLVDLRHGHVVRLGLAQVRGRGRRGVGWRISLD